MNTILANKKVLIATVPADGHFNPLTQIAKTLQGAGCDVRWYTSMLYADRIRKLGIFHYPFKKAVDVNGTNISELVPEIKTSDPARRITLYRIQYAKRSTECFADIADICKDFAADLIITDSLFPAIPFIKHKLQVPLISIGVVPLAEDSVDTAPYGLGLHPPKNEQQQQHYKSLYLESPERYKDATDLFQSLIEKENIPYKRSIMENTLIKHPDLYLQIGCPTFEYKRSDLGQNIRFIGGLMPYRIQEPENQWYDERLERYKKVILVTQGTVETHLRKLLEPTLEAFADTDTLVIATTGGRPAKDLKEKYSFDNIIIEDYIRFDDVMPYADVYVTNGGYGGVMLSIMHKLPIVAAGLHEGKNEVCARVGYFNIGIDLKTETPTTATIREAVGKILIDKNYKHNVSQLSHQLKAYHPEKLFLNYAEDLLNLSFN